MSMLPVIKQWVQHYADNAKAGHLCRRFFFLFFWFLQMLCCFQDPIWLNISLAYHVSANHMDSSSNYLTKLGNWEYFQKKNIWMKWNGEKKWSDTVNILSSVVVTQLSFPFCHLLHVFIFCLISFYPFLWERGLHLVWGWLPFLFS